MTHGQARNARWAWLTEVVLPLAGILALSLAASFVVFRSQSAGVMTDSECELIPGKPNPVVSGERPSKLTADAAAAALQASRYVLML